MGCGRSDPPGRLSLAWRRSRVQPFGQGGVTVTVVATRDRAGVVLGTVAGGTP